ncbi:Fc receptor-like protein 4 isoform X5 [Prinia subflava]|uniref:Fc receptor-like protein 4 isoform X5 n=1 Tax=Prinia subflava TaxID=208062 RepID=UPI002FDF6FBB
MAGDTGMAGKVALLLWAQTLGLAGESSGDAVSYPAVPSPVVALAGWCPLSPAGAQTTQLLVQPPWTPAVLWDRVTLTCQGSGTTSATTWYKDGQRWGQNRGDPVTVTESGTYTCDRPGSGLSPPVTVLNELFSVPVLEGPPEVTEGSPLNLSCLSTPSPLRPRAPLLHLFYRDGQLVGGPQGSPQLLVPVVGVSHSGNYSCQVWSEGGTVQKSSARLGVTVHMPVANATITPGPLSHQVHTGDPVTLRCSVQVGSAPVTFTWLHNGQEVARGPVLELGDVNVTHSGTYQCVATNQLGQDGHRVFRALSPELALEVTPQRHWNTAVATGVGVSLLFLVLLVGGVVGWRRWNHMAARKQQERAPPDPPAPPEEGEVLYTHVVSTKQMGGSPSATTLQDPPVTYAELRGPHGRLRELSDMHGNML